jgi:hypothetical protein
MALAVAKRQPQVALPDGQWLWRLPNGNRKWRFLTANGFGGCQTATASGAS